jgi:hypothetical protein
MIKRTVVVFEHELSLDAFPQLVNMSEEDLTSMLNTAVVELYELREKEQSLNEHGTHSFIRVKDVI